MRRKFLAVAAALALAGPTLVLAAPDEVHKQLMQRSIEARRKLEAARGAQGAERSKLMQEHLALMDQMMKQMNSARPGPNASPPQMREWIDEHMKVMDEMLKQMMQGERMMMMGSDGGAKAMMKSGR
jgi:uncharacterized protein YicC (UPF0701 family)